MQSVTRRDPNKYVPRLTVALVVVFVVSLLVTKRKVDEIPVVAGIQKIDEAPQASQFFAPVVSPSGQIAITAPDRTLPYDDPPNGVVAVSDRGPESLSVLKQRAAKFAFDDFLLATRVPVSIPVAIDEFSLGSAGGEQMEFQGTSRLGDEIILVVKTGIDEDSLRRWFVSDRGFGEAVLMREPKGRSASYRATVDGRHLLIRTGVVSESTTTYLYVWMKSRDHTEAEITAF